jgi:hypothetical protein
MALKLMYLAKRNPSFPTQPAFAPRWRQHGALAMSLPTWTKGRRYVHADALPPSSAAPAHTWDGVGVMWPNPSESLFKAGPPSEDAKKTAEILLADELIAFAGPVMPLAVLTEEEVVKPGRLTEVTAYLWYKNVADAEQAAAKLAKVTSPAPARIALSRVLDQPVSKTPLNHYKGIAEVGANERKDLDAILKAAGVAGDVTIVAHDVLLDGSADQVLKSA